MDTGNCDRIPTVCTPGETKIKKGPSLRGMDISPGMRLRCEQEGRKTKDDLKTSECDKSDGRGIALRLTVTSFR